MDAARTSLRRYGAAYLVLVGAVVGSLLTAVVLPMVAGDTARSTQGSVSESADGGPLTAGSGSSASAMEGIASGPGTSGAAAAGPGSARTGGTVPDVAAIEGAVGVTDKEIKIGYLLLDVGSIGRIGITVPGVDPEQQREAFEAFMADVNQRGGIHGRKLVGVYEVFDVLSQDDMRRACLAIRDHKPFAVAASGGFYGPAMLCITEEGKTPLINQGSQGTPSEYMRRSGGLLVTMYPEGDRVMLNWVAELDRLGKLKGKKIGIVSQETTNPNDTVIGGSLVPALKRFGYTPTHITRLSADQSAAASQMPIEVQQMSRQGVDLVMLTTTTLASSQFVQTADNQAYRPQYTLTDWASMNNDTSNQSMPDSYHGTIGITSYKTGEHRVGIKEGPEEQDCRRVYEKYTKRQLAEWGQNENGLTLSNCTTFRAFVRGAELAGRALTRTSFSRGVQAIGDFPMAMWGRGTFKPNKLDAADQVRTIEWRADCRCLVPTSGFRPSRF